MSTAHLITVDWGTTSWRGVLWDANGQMLGARSAPQGILQVAPGAFEQAWMTLVGDWIHSGAQMCLMSGMVGSRQGWVEVPYVRCPATFETLAAHVTWLGQDELPMPVGIVAGLMTEQYGLPDVMRGEEMQIFGAAHLLQRRSATLVLPGTHSKWAVLQEGAITGFRSYMTGEVYALLRQHSILARLMPSTQEEAWVEGAFVQGVRTSKEGPLMSSLFSARTLGLVDRLPSEALPSYLSGLLIGHEMNAQVTAEADMQTDLKGPLILVGSPELTLRYRIAAEDLGVQVVEPAGHAAATGLWRLAQTLTSTGRVR
jgi:2-dehydro-3-deoxygalactonokinase